jgi:hypothetical protein
MLKFTVKRPGKELLGLRNSNSLVSLYLECNEKSQALFLNDFCKKVVKDIDKSDIISSNVIISPHLGGIDATSLSGGVCTVLAVYFLCNEGRQDYYFNSAYMDDNCIPYIMEIAKDFDVIMWLSAPLGITDDIFNKYPNTIYSLEYAGFINSADDFKRAFQELEYKVLRDIEETEQVEKFKTELSDDFGNDTYIPNEFYFKFLNHEYRIPIKHKITQLYEMSATGNSELIRTITLGKSNPEILVPTTNIAPGKIKTNISISELLATVQKGYEHLIILDETNDLFRCLLKDYEIIDSIKRILDFHGIDRKSLIKDYIYKSKCKFIFISRNMQTYYPLPKDAVFVLKNSEDGFTHNAVPYF